MLLEGGDVDDFAVVAAGDGRRIRGLLGNFRRLG